MKSLKFQTIFTSVSFLIQSLFGLLYGLLISKYFLSTPVATDSFYISYNIYLFFNMFAVTLRVSVVPILQELKEKQNYAMITLAVSIIFVSLSFILVALSIPIAHLMSSTLQGISLLRNMILIFSGVVLFQGFNGYLSGYLSVERKLNYISIVSVIGSGIGLLSFVLLKEIGIYAAPVGFFITHLIIVLLLLWDTKNGLILKFQFSNFSFLYSKNITFTIFKTAIPYIGFNFAFLVSQSSMKNFVEGEITAFSYAYSLISIMVAAIAGSIGYTISIRMSELKETESIEYIENFISKNYFLTLLTLFFFIGAFLSCNKSLGIFIFQYLPSNSISVDDLHLVYVFDSSSVVLSIGGIFLGLFSILVPVNLTYKQIKGFFRYTILVLLFHIIVTYSISSQKNTIGVSGAYSTACFLLFLYQPIQLLKIFPLRFVLKLFMVLSKFFIIWVVSLVFSFYINNSVMLSLLEVFKYAVLNVIIYSLVYISLNLIFQKEFFQILKAIVIK
ncbi:MAG: hypothetical protein KDK90_11635 [Leptospiraceae bacterium]|nr:hypothetical protein [Leptospiraceae bacterium]